MFIATVRVAKTEKNAVSVKEIFFILLYSFKRDLFNAKTESTLFRSKTIIKRKKKQKHHDLLCFLAIHKILCTLLHGKYIQL